MSEQSFQILRAPSNSPAQIAERGQESEYNTSTFQNPLIQCKFNIGANDDPLEDEADKIANQIMRMPEQHFIQRKCAHCEEEEKEGETIHRQPLSSLIQRKESGSTTVASEAISNKLTGSRGKGSSIDGGTRTFMENRFGADFSDVKIHTGDEAIQMNRELSAKAFTVGNDIYFNDREYEPHSDKGKHLLAHELTHTIQQGNKMSIQRQANVNAGVANGGLTEEMLNQIARRLRAAMEGLGTDEEAIYSAFSGRTQDQVNAIQRRYDTLYNRSLLADLQDELTEDEMKHLAIFSPTAVEGHANGFAELAASQLHNAMEGLGTDESSIMSALTGRTVDERAAIQQAYRNLTHRNLRDDLIDELSGTELTTALRLLEQGMLNTEDEIYLAVAGLGTDEESLRTALRGIQGDRGRIRDVIEAYKAKGYGDMLSDVRDDLSDSDLEEAIESMHGRTTSRSCNAIQRRVGLFAISDAASMAQNAINELSGDIARGQLSSDVESGLTRYFNPGNAANAVNIGLARNVLPAFVNAYRDLLMTSDVDCGDTGLCIGKQNCASGRVTPAWTGVGRLSTVQLCSSFFECDSDKTATMLHEFVHHTGVDDHQYVFQPGFASLTPIGDQSPTDSLDNSDSYAYFARSLM